MILTRARGAPLAKGCHNPKGLQGSKKKSSYRQFGAKIKVGRVLKLSRLLFMQLLHKACGHRGTNITATDVHWANGT